MISKLSTVKEAFEAKINSDILNFAEVRLIQLSLHKCYNSQIGLNLSLHFCIDSHRLPSQSVVWDLSQLYFSFLKFSENVARTVPIARSHAGLVLSYFKINKMNQNVVLSSTVPWKLSIIICFKLIKSKFNLCEAFHWTSSWTSPPWLMLFP